MKTEITIRNGSGWNHYPALRTLKTLPAGTRGLLTRNGVQRLEISPYDSERPLGIAARFMDADGEELYCLRFDQSDDADWIRQRIVALLKEGIQNHLAARAKERARETAVRRITAWRRNFDTVLPTKDASGPLRAKIGDWRKQTGRHSRKECWNFTHKILARELTFTAVREQFFSK